MSRRELHDAIRATAETADYRPLFDYFADDIEFRVSIAVRSPASGDLRGRTSVRRHLASLDSGDSPPDEQVVDIFADGDRIVACRNATLALGTGSAIRSECSLVFDIRDGLISRLLINHELSIASSTQLDIAEPIHRYANRGGQLSTMANVTS